jgi:hypothetical protein
VWLGRYQVGNTIVFLLQCKNADEVAAAPTDAPQIKLWSPAGTLIHQAKMPSFPQVTGLFYYNVFRGGLYDVAGSWNATYRYMVSTYHGAHSDNFEVMAGGHMDGHVVGMYHYRRPQADFLVHQTESGNIRKGQNPRVP